MKEVVDPRSSEAGHSDYVYLLGLPTLRGFLDQLHQVAAHRPIDERLLIDRWLEANAHVQALQKTEAGCADNPELAPLPASMRDAAEAHLRAQAGKRSMRCGTFAWHMVELDRLMVYQRTINLRHIEELRAARSADLPTDAELIQLAIGKDNIADVQFTLQSDNVFTLASRSADVRFLDMLPLSPESIQDASIAGQPALALTLFIGFSNNTCIALHYRNRLLLLNASHRLYDLRERGVTHVPCLVQSITHEAELGLMGEEVRQFSHLFSDPRPSMFKDYFNPTLHMVFPLTTLKYLVQVQITHQKLRVPAG